MSALLEVDRVRVRFRHMSTAKALLHRVHDPFIDAVCDVSFQIEAGETLGLVGESGSGKSTIARAAMGLEPIQNGSIRFQGKDLANLDAHARAEFRREAALMFQDPLGSLSPRLTVRSLITEPFRIHGKRGRNIDAEANRLLDMVGLGMDFARRFPHQLSGGQARRVGVARALALNPKLLIADEPTAGLDVSVQGEVLNLLARLQEQLGIAILIITHNLHVVRHITDRMAIMYLGRFVEQGETESIFHQPKHPYTEALLSASPTPDPEVAKDRVEIKGEVPSLVDRPHGCEFHPRCPYARNKCNSEPPTISETETGRLFTCHYPLHADDQMVSSVSRT